MAWLAWAAVAASAASVWAAATPAQKCAADKMEAAGKYAECRHEAEARFALRPDQSRLNVDLDRCATTQASAWARLEAQAAAAGSACPSSGDQRAIQETNAVETAVTAGAISGGYLLDGFWSMTLQSGQTTCYANVDGASPPIPCPGSGQDGELTRGLVRDYVDNGDGTITDLRTELMWEKESDDGSIHDGDILRDWNGAFAKVAALNAMAFAGHTDWRLPNAIELQSLTNYGATNPAVSAPFHAGCTLGCTVLTCSCTRSWPYWTSTTDFGAKNFATGVHFLDGLTHTQRKTNQIPVRAVRGGL